MKRNATRTTLVTLGLASLAACIVNLSFSMDKPGVPLKSDPNTTSITQQAILVDLADYKEITDHKDNIKSLDLDYVDINITALGPANTAHTVSGKVTLRRNLTDPATSDVTVGSLNAVAVQANQSVRIQGTPELDAFLLQQLQNAGKFYVIVSGSVDSGVADATVDLNLHASMGYDTGIF
ncbi:MAG: hypothetical protein ABR567_20720 [Myxococcales bacterium]|nr:hypothetical protein [Myxococcales bacterium]